MIGCTGGVARLTPLPRVYKYKAHCRKVFVWRRMTGNGYTSSVAAATWSAETVEGPDGQKSVISAPPPANSALEDAAAEFSMLLFFG